MPEKESFHGGCTCGQVRYRMRKAPMFVHCCHCRWCQRETGTAFALNGLVEVAGSQPAARRGRNDRHPFQQRQRPTHFPLPPL